MKLQTQPNKNTCLITSLAMVLDVPVKKLISLTHDGPHTINEIIALTIKEFRIQPFYLEDDLDWFLEHFTGIVNLPEGHSCAWDGKRLLNPIGYYQTLINLDSFIGVQVYRLY